LEFRSVFSNNDTPDTRSRRNVMVSGLRIVHHAPLQEARTIKETRTMGRQSQADCTVELAEVEQG
jgi:hypothetical protein